MCRFQGLACYHYYMPAMSMLQEMNTLKAHADFRLWLTAEVHPRFPTILLQSSLKVTYEVRLHQSVELISVMMITIKIDIDDDEEDDNDDDDDDE